jgi:hypothetical protein
MASPSLSQTAGAARATAQTGAISFEKFAGWCALAAGVSGFLYSIAFIVLKDAGISAFFLMLGGLLATPVLLAVYERLRETDASFARWGLMLGLAAAIGSLIHGGYDLANAINPPASPNLDLPSQIDPRGMLTFGVAGIGLLVFAWLMSRTGTFPRGLAYIGYIAGVLLLWIYLGRLIILQPTNLIIVVPALLAGFIANPAWYIGLGLALMRGRR